MVPGYNWFISDRANLEEFEGWEESEMGKSWYLYVGGGNLTLVRTYTLFVYLLSCLYFHDFANEIY